MHRSLMELQKGKTCPIIQIVNSLLTTSALPNSFLEKLYLSHALFLIGFFVKILRKPLSNFGNVGILP